MSNLKSWSRLELGEVIKLQGGYAFKSEEFKTQGIPVIRISNIQDNKIDLSDVTFVDERNIKDDFKVTTGDILIAMSGATTGKLGRYSQSTIAYLNQRVGKFVVKDNQRIYYDLVYYLASHEPFQKSILGDAAGGAQPNISAGQIESISVEIPPLNEQKKIAEILTSADRVIELTSMEIDKLKDLKKGMMQELLTKGIGHTKFKDSPVGRIPESWEVVKLEDVCEKIQDGTHFSPKSTEGPFKYITSKNIRFGYMDLSNMNYISESEHNEIYKRCNVRLGDVLLTKDGANTGNAALNILNEQFSLLSSVALLRCDEKNIHNSYLLNYLLSPFFQKFIQDSMTGNAITRITLTILNSFKIPLPSYKEQKNISNKLNSIDFNVYKKEEFLKKILNIKKGLMNDLLTGKVRVNC